MVCCSFASNILLLFHLGGLLRLLKGENGEEEWFFRNERGDRYLNRKILSGKMIDKRSEEKRRTLSFVFDKEIFWEIIVFTRVLRIWFTIFIAKAVIDEEFRQSFPRISTSSPSRSPGKFFRLWFKRFTSSESLRPLVSRVLKYDWKNH